MQRVTRLTHGPHRRVLINWSVLVRKLSSPKLSPSEFEPGLILTLRSVLDEAVNQIHVAHRTPATKAKMAERILRAASDGVRDPIQLTAVAVEDGMQPAE